VDFWFFKFIPMSKSEENWLTQYDALKSHVLETGHFPNKHDKRLNWYKYNAKLIKQGKLPEEKERLIHELEGMRSGEHTGGRRKKVDAQLRFDVDG
jgi:hypothetical protein